MVAETIVRLRRRLRVRGTTLAQTPPEWEGISWAEWEELRWDDWNHEAALAREQEAIKVQNGPPELPLPPVATGRDNYGWRDMPRAPRKPGEKFGE